MTTRVPYTMTKGKIAALLVLLMAAPVSAGNFVTDSFIDAENTVLTSHAPEIGGAITKHGSYPLGSGEIAANRSRSNLETSSLFQYAATPGAADYDVTATIRCQTTPGQCGIAGRIQSNGSFYLAWIHPLSLDVLRLYKKSGGSFQELGSYNFPGTAATTYTLKLEIRDASKKVYLDGVEVISSNDNSITGAGKVGFWFNGGTHGDAAGWHIDALTADDTTTTALTSGTAAWVSADDDAVSLVVGNPVNGTAPYSYQWHASQTSGFTPATGTAISGATSQSLVHDPGAGVWFYKCVTSDSGSETATSNQVAGSLWGAPFVVGFIGDSITQDSDFNWPAKCGEHLEAMDGIRSVTIVNRGHSGATTGSFPYTAAETAFTSAGVTHTVVMLGVNDSSDTNAVSAATYKSQLQTIVNAEVAAGRTVLLMYPTAYKPGLIAGYGEAGLARLGSYLPKIDELVNGTTVLAGPTEQFGLFAAKLSLLKSDGIHTSQAGSNRLASLAAGVLYQQAP